jgi:type I restriction enzyme, S subunit
MMSKKSSEPGFIGLNDSPDSNSKKSNKSFNNKNHNLSQLVVSSDSEWKETIFGTVASDWEFISSTEFCLRVTDGTHDSPKEQKTGKHLITSKHIKGKDVDFENAYLISEEDFTKINERSKVDQWDVIISMIGEYCGFSFVERNEEINYAVKNVGLFKTGNKHKAYWLYYFLNSKIGRFILETNKSGTSQPYLTLGFLREFPVLYPSSEKEARVIVEILSSLDDKIDLLNHQNKTLEQLAETLFRQWFVIDEKQKEKLGIVVQTTSGGTPLRNNPEYFINGVYKWVKSKELQGTYIFETEELITKEALRNSSAKLLPKNSVLIALYGATVGEYAILADQATCNQAICAIIPNEDYPYTYLFHIIKTNKENLINLAVGSAQQNISQLLIRDLEVSTDKVLIEKFNAEAEGIFEKIKININQIRTLTRLRDTLLPKLMSGEVRVKMSEL